MHSILSRAIDARDEYTRGHSARVTAIAEAIARRLDWDEDRLELLQLGGPLHDVGKLAIPDEVLRKPGRLDDEEMAQIREPGLALGSCSASRRSATHFRTSSTTTSAGTAPATRQGAPARKFRSRLASLRSRMLTTR